MTTAPDPLDSRSPACARRIAEVQLRDPAPRVPARVHWPADGATAPALVVLFTDPGLPGGLADRLVERFGAVVLAVAAAHAAEAHAALAWAADHAAELGAHPRCLAIVGEGRGAALAERVAALIADEGWPPLRAVVPVWPGDDPEAGLDALAPDLTGPAGYPGRAS